MACEHRPSLRVVEEARDYLKAAQLIEQYAYSGNSGLFWPAAMNAGLASELYLKSCLVESDPDHPADTDDPEGFLSSQPGLPVAGQTLPISVDLPQS
ncbi:hypothetical protein HX870_29615 [Pseudomonas gingeri]|uniref:hypothetical protein n=1 Tax=Pseudomonas gingeri TaxID=117681 RepID=UPI0015A2B251|nr:hypothetical protein [Pseudomonas gingeri]NWD71771.1 hypothetical protein [Pseudomonas gingeri]